MKTQMFSCETFYNSLGPVCEEPSCFEAAIAQRQRDLMALQSVSRMSYMYLTCTFDS